MLRLRNVVLVVNLMYLLSPSPVSNNKNGKNNESTSVTVEDLREANKPVVPSNTDMILLLKTITRLNKYNKSILLNLLF